MARIRSIHPGFFTDEQVMQLSVDCPLAVMLLLGIWSEADDAGIFEWKPLTLKARAVPAAGDIGSLLAALEAGNFIRRYELGGREYGAVRNFKHFQRPKKPKTIHPTTPYIEAYVGTSSEPVGNQFGTGGEKSPQMEDGGGRREDGDIKPEMKSSGPRERRANPIVILQSELDALTAQRWVGHLEEKGKPPSTAQAEEMCGVLRAVKASGGNPAEAVRLAINRGWLSLNMDWLRKAEFAFKSPPADPAIDWASRMDVWRKDKTWGAWGPKPGEPGCQVPAELQRTAA